MDRNRAGRDRPSEEDHRRRTNGLDPGTYSPAVDDGYYVMLQPLAVGSHTLHFGGTSAGCPVLGGAPFSLAVTYQLTVVPVSLK